MKRSTLVYLLVGLLLAAAASETLANTVYVGETAAGRMAGPGSVHDLTVDLVAGDAEALDTATAVYRTHRAMLAANGDAEPRLDEILRELEASAADEATPNGLALNGSVAYGEVISIRWMQNGKEEGLEMQVRSGW